MIASHQQMRNLLLLLCIILSTSCEQSKPTNPFQAIDLSWRYTEPVDFKLTGSNGKIYKLSDFKDKVVVVVFGYTYCPEICPTTLADLAQIMRLLHKDAEKVQVLFVTLDYERDTPSLLAKYIPSFDRSFIALYGDSVTTAQAAKVFGVTYEKEATKSGYLINHSDGTYLIGINGKLVLLSPYGQNAEVLARDIKLLLKLTH
ncbi:MAG: SCO family protein [Candidatus Nitrotoga sp.]|jgi:protein SCO1